MRGIHCGVGCGGLLVSICWENWRRILDACRRLKIDVPIGFGVESVTKSKAEQDAAINLFKELRFEMDNFYSSKAR